MSDDRVVALLEQIRDLLAERRPAKASLDVQDRRALERLAPVVCAQFPDGFSTWELIDVAGMQDIAGADMRLALDGLSSHRVGKLLRRALDSGPVAGYRVTSLARGRWRLIADASRLTGDQASAKVRASDRRR